MAERIIPEKSIGRKFGKLTVIRFVRFDYEPSGIRVPIYLFQCECGNEKEIKFYNVRNGNTTSCGCYRVALKTKHGHATRKAKTPEYRTWGHIIDRATNPSNNYAHRYSERGIRVCDEWQGEHGFEKFFEHIGRRPSEGYSVDRIDNDKGYEPGNVRWATREEQASNTSRNIFGILNGERVSLAEACRRKNLSYYTVLYRLKRGWKWDRAVSTPVKRSGVGT